MGLLDLFSGERLEETRRNMEKLIEGTEKLISQLETQRSTYRELIKALKSHERTMKELRDEIGATH